MGDLTWLNSLGQGGALAVAVGLIGWLGRWIVRREREISGQWREVAEKALANNVQLLAAQERHNEAVTRILTAIESPNATGRHHAGGWDGYSGYAETSAWQPSNQWRR